MTVAVPDATRLVHTYRPRGAALELLNYRGDEVILSGPAGTGKSRAALEKLHLVALRNPKFKGLMVRKTMKSLTESGLVTYREKVANESIDAGHVSFFGGAMDRPPGWMYSNGAFIAVGGMDKPSKIMSTEYDIVFAQEATELEPADWEAIISRLRNGGLTYSQVIADCNPSTPFHWIKKRAQDGLLTMMESRHEDNPVYFDLLPDGRHVMTAAGHAYIEGKLDRLTGPRYKRLRLGQWVAAEGQIYEEWDDAHHLVKPFRIPKEWPRFWVIDFGYKNPFVCQRWAMDPDGRLFMYAEIYMTGRLVEEHARDVLRQVTKTCALQEDGDKDNPLKALQGGRRAWREPIPVAVICDHDAEGRATFEEHTGLVTTAALKEVDTGIQAVKARLARTGDDKARLFMLRDARTERDPALVDVAKPTCSAEEWGGYVWKRPPLTSAQPKAPPEEPLKVDDHGMDTTRYLVMHVDQGASYQLRVLTW